MWVIAGLVALVFVYEAVAIFFRWLTITDLIKRYTHLAIIVALPALMLLGYTLRVGGC